MHRLLRSQSTAPTSAKRAARLLALVTPALGLLVAPFAAQAEIQEPSSLQRFTSGGHVLGFDSAGYFASNGTYALRVRFEGASGGSGSVVGNATDTEVSRSTAREVPEFQGIAYTDVWPGIDVEYDAPKGGIARSTWTVAPGVSPGAIRLRYNRPVALSENGSLQVRFETGVLTESAPIAWQEVDGRRDPVKVAFATVDEDLVGFTVGAYRSELPLVIDPTLEWNTFLGGAGSDSGRAIAVDAGGNVYVGGTSYATWGSPVRAYTSSDSDAWAAKLNPSGTLVWNTFLGEAGNDTGRAITVDAGGNLYVTGRSSTTWGSPVQAHTSSYDAFAAKISQPDCSNFVGDCCPSEPSTTCLEGWGKGMLLVKETTAGKEKLIAKFVKGPEIPASDFGDPSVVDGTSYAACIYDDQGAFVDSLEIDRAGLACGPKICWRPMGSRGFMYKDSNASADGVSLMRLIAGPAGRSMILIKGANNSRKGQLELPTGISAGLFESDSVTVQLVGSDAPECFSMTLGKIKKQQSHSFKAVK